jgi:hypothetical protein
VNILCFFSFKTKSQNAVLLGLAEVKNSLCFCGHTVASVSEISSFKRLLAQDYDSENQYEPFYVNMRTAST